MKKLILLSLASLCAVCGYATAYKVNVGTFSKLSVPDPVEVVYTSDPAKAGYVTYECEDELADSFFFSNNGQTLKIQISADNKTAPADLPVVYVYSEFLQSVENSGPGTVRVNLKGRYPEFKSVLMGNGVLQVKGLDVAKCVAKIVTGKGILQVEGNCDTAVLDLTGKGSIRAQALIADKVDCKIFGGGSIHCHPIKELTSKGVGSTTVYYTGHPESIKKKGGGKLVHIGD